MADEKDFKVIDRRSAFRDEKEDAQKTAKSAPAPEQKGEGFTMKEADEHAAEPNQIDFATFVFSLATGALIQCGIAPDPMTGKTSKNLDLAKQNIDLLAMMKEKTKGNLTPDETQLIDSLLAEVRIRFVEASKTK